MTQKVERKNSTVLVKKIKKKVRKAIKFIIFASSYLLIIPISLLAPKKNNVVLINRFGNFEGNLKYLFIYLDKLKCGDYTFIYLTDKKEVFMQLRESNYEVWFYPSLSTLIRLFRTRLIIVDGNEWTKHLKYFFLYRSKKVQVWHGTGLKAIGLLRPNIRNLGYFRKLLKRDNIFYDLVSLSSKFQVKTRAEAFRYGHILINGLPRNDIFFNSSLIREIDLNSSSSMIEKIRCYKKDGYKIITYAPTWRKEKRAFNYLPLADMEKFAKNYRLLFVVKLHSKQSGHYDFSNYDYIIEYEKHDDVYPLLTFTDLLITDYSSIYLDYLLTGRPIVFYTYDKEQYINDERELLLNYDEVTPGPVCHSYSELERELYFHLVEGKDKYRAERDELRDLFFQYNDGKSAERLWYTIKEYILGLDRQQIVEQGKILKSDPLNRC